MIKVMTLVGTRPELIKMSRVIAECDNHTEHTLIHSGQNYDYELNQVFFEDLELRKPDYFLGCTGDTPSKAIADIISKTDDILDKVTPDALLIYGDTNTGLAVITAKRRKIPVFHMEAGNRCFDQRVPEELNRKIIDHVSDINMVLSEHARRYLVAEGIRPDTIIKTGSHMPEVLDYYKDGFAHSNILDELNLTPKQFFIVSAHREENVDDTGALEDLLGSLQAIAVEYDYPVIVSTHPRTRKRLADLKHDALDSRIVFAKPFGFFDYIRLQMEAYCVVSDSGTVTEEASILNLPAVTIRNAHERPEGADEGTLIMCGLKPRDVLESIRIVTAQHTQSERVALPVADYGLRPVSKQIVRTVLSYTSYVNRNVWRKP
jgi:UDP-N-acetylglucosamine 2-epimerase (non-hydrolysing)